MAAIIHYVAVTNGSPNYHSQVFYKSCGTVRNEAQATQNMFLGTYPLNRFSGGLDWLPDCEADGSFKIYQRTISGEPFCVTPQGTPINQVLPRDRRQKIFCECPTQSYQVTQFQSKIASVKEKPERAAKHLTSNAIKDIPMPSKSRKSFHELSSCKCCEIFRTIHKEFTYGCVWCEDVGN